MYFEGIEKNQTRLWIINSLLELLGRKEYHAILLMPEYQSELLPDAFCFRNQNPQF